MHLVASLVIIDQLRPDCLVALLDNNVSNISSLAIDDLKAPDLSRGPSVLDRVGTGLDDLVRLDDVLGPSLFEESLVFIIILQLGQLLPCRETLDSAEDVILVFGPTSVDSAILRGSFNAGSTGLLDVDVIFSFGISVFLDDESDVDQTNGFADQPANALLEGY
jgi:hypothetical protein